MLNSMMPEVKVHKLDSIIFSKIEEVMEVQGEVLKVRKELEGQKLNPRLRQGFEDLLDISESRKLDDNSWLIYDRNNLEYRFSFDYIEDRSSILGVYTLRNRYDYDKDIVCRISYKVENRGLPYVVNLKADYVDDSQVEHYIIVSELNSILKGYDYLLDELGSFARA